MANRILKKEDLYNYLDDLDDFLEDMITLVAVGGTAMILLDLRPTTKDFDFTGPKNSIILLKNAIHVMKPAFNIDCWPNGQVVCFTLPLDYLDNSIRIKTYKMIDLRALNPLDIVVTKLIQRNYDDIEKCIRKFDLTESAITQRTLEGDNIPECGSALRYDSYLNGLNLIIHKFFDTESSRKDASRNMCT